VIYKVGLVWSHNASNQTSEFVMDWFQQSQDGSSSPFPVFMLSYANQLLAEVLHLTDKYESGSHSHPTHSRKEKNDGTLQKYKTICFNLFKSKIIY